VVVRRGYDRRVPNPYSRFVDSPWDVIVEETARFASAHPGWGHVDDVAQSIAVSEVADQLAGLLSMHDLVVAPRPVAHPQRQVIAAASRRSRNSRKLTATLDGTLEPQT
jgi:hypothetical protein